MSMATDARPLTRADLLALPDDGQRHELVSGVHIVTPAPQHPHQRVLSRLFVLLHPYVERHGLGELIWSPADLAFGEDEVLQPDLFLVPPPYVAGDRWEQIERLALVIEVLSPSTARYDRGLKRDRYQRAGVPEYWVVDLEARLIERWRPADDRPEVARTTLVWHPTGAPESLTLVLDAIFPAA
jgi:Uma2 family endonuclease